VLPLSYNLKSLVIRWKSAVLAIFGVGLVVAVLVGLLAMASGFRLVLSETGSSQNAIVLQQGSQSELSSSIPKGAGDRVADDPRIAHGADGQPLVSPELVTIVALPRRSDGELSNITVRGVTPAVFNVRSGIRIIAGRNVKPGLFEVIVGKSVRARIRGLDVGRHVRLMKGEFEVVGVMDAGGSAFESEIWGDFDAMASAFNRAGSQNSLTVRLADPNAASAFDRDLEADPLFHLQAKSEQQYYEDEAGPLSKFLRGLAMFVSVVMGAGAVFGAMNTMNAVVAARSREVGTLRALGFSRTIILVGFVFEGAMLALAGGVLGCMVSLLINGLQATTTENRGEIAFAFHVTAVDLGHGLLFAVIMGIVGSLLPAFRAARLPIVAALREA
jgi:putative ABC transport system permease protein